MKFKVLTYRSPNDFKFGSWTYEHNSDGGCNISGRLKCNNHMSKFQKIYRVN